MAKRYFKYRKYSKKRKRRRPSFKKTVKAIVRREIKPTQTVLRLLTPVTPQNINLDFRALHLNPISLSQWPNNRLIFGTGADDTYRNQAKHVSMYADIVLRAGSENEGTNITLYIVSPKNDCKDTVFNSANGGLILVDNEDYTVTNGQAFVNPGTFNIHMRKKILFPPRTDDADPSRTLYRRFHWKMRPNHMIKNERGNFMHLAVPPRPSHNYYLLAFNDNSFVDAEFPTMEMNVMNTYIA